MGQVKCPVSKFGYSYLKLLSKYLLIMGDSHKNFEDPMPYELVKRVTEFETANIF